MAKHSACSNSILAAAVVALLAGCAEGPDTDIESLAYTDAVRAFEAGDYEAAFPACRLLADGGDADAAFRVADMFEFGLGVMQDPQRAAIYFCKAARRGHAEAQFKLAQRCEGGVGVPRSSQKALTWYHIALANAELSARIRYWANVYVMSYFSVHAFDKPWARAIFDKAVCDAQVWRPGDTWL